MLEEVLSIGMAIFHLGYDDIMRIPVMRRYRLAEKLIEIERKKWSLK